MNISRPVDITTRNDIARDIIAGFAAVTPSLAGAWRLIDTALADLPAVLADLGRAQAELEAVRLDRANLLAAIQLDRKFTGIDLSPDFARLAAGRLAQAVTDRTEGTR